MVEPSEGMPWGEFRAAAERKQIVKWSGGLVERLFIRAGKVWCQRAESLACHPIYGHPKRNMKCALLEEGEALVVAAEMDRRLEEAAAALPRGQIVRVKAVFYTPRGVICALPGGLLGFNPNHRLTREIFKTQEAYRKIVKIGDEFDAKVKVDGGVIISRRSLFPKVKTPPKPPKKKKAPPPPAPKPTPPSLSPAPVAPAAPAPVAVVPRAPAAPKERCKHGMAPASCGICTPPPAKPKGRRIIIRG